MSWQPPTSKKEFSGTRAQCASTIEVSDASGRKVAKTFSVFTDGVTHTPDTDAATMSQGRAPRGHDAVKDRKHKVPMESARLRRLWTSCL